MSFIFPKSVFVECVHLILIECIQYGGVFLRVPLPTHIVGRILTGNRCTDPCSHYSVPMWERKTGLEDVLRIDLSGLNDDKPYSSFFLRPQISAALLPGHRYEGLLPRFSPMKTFQPASRPSP